MSTAGISNTQNLSHEQFGGMIDGIQNITSNFLEKHGYQPPEQDDEPETRSTAFQPTRYRAPEPLTFADH
jgi:hypothetical protein